MAALMVVDAALVLRAGDAERELALNDFYHDYQVNDLRPGEFLASIKIPLPDDDVLVTSQKWSKRFDQDISAVCTAYQLVMNGDTVKSFRMACGGMAATVRRASLTEAALLGQRWNEVSIERACSALEKDFAPIGDMRASATGRMQVCQNLLRRFFAQTQDADLETVYCYGR
jgi:xanthine dehydrogenase small subunit